MYKGHINDDTQDNCGNLDNAAANRSSSTITSFSNTRNTVKYLSMYKGHINDDTQDRLKAKLVEAILKFRFDR